MTDVFKIIVKYRRKSIAKYRHLSPNGNRALRILSRKKSSFVSSFSQLTFGLPNPYCNSLVCLAVLILEIMAKKLHHSFFRSAY